MTRHEWPTFSEEQVDYLLRTFPPRCKMPGESLEEHLLYAGHVELARKIADQRTIATATLDVDLEADIERELRATGGRAV